MANFLKYMVYKATCARNGVYPPYDYATWVRLHGAWPYR
jgi:hypothetical protein